MISVTQRTLKGLQGLGPILDVLVRAPSGNPVDRFSLFGRPGEWTAWEGDICVDRGGRRRRLRRRVASRLSRAAVEVLS